MATAFAVALGVLRWFLDTKIGRWCGVLVAVVTALALYTAWIEHSARAAVLADLLVKTKAESERRGKVIADATTRGDETVAILEQKDRINAELQGKLDKLSQGNDARDCLDANSVGRLQLDRRPSGPGAWKPPSGSPR